MTGPVNNLYILHIVIVLFGFLSSGLPLTAEAAAGLQGFEPAQIERQVESERVDDYRPLPSGLPGSAKTRVELAERSFTLAGVLVEGSSVYSNLEFLPLYRALLGRTVTVGELREIADAITRRYHRDGYFLSSAVLPAQEISFGIVRIRIVEGYLEQWCLAGNESFSSPLLERMLQPVLDQRPARKPELISVLRTINGLPGITVRPELRAVAGRPGAYTLLLDADRKRYEGNISIDNFGSEFIGPVRGIASLALYDMFKRHESWRLKLAKSAETEELSYLDIATGWPLGTKGMWLELEATAVRSNPGGDLESLDAEIANNRYRIGVAYPLSRAQDSRQSLAVYLDNYRSRTDIEGTRRLEDRLYSLEVEYRRVFASGSRLIQSLTVSMAQGLPFDDSRIIDTEDGSGTGETDFTRFLFNYTYRRLLGASWRINAAVAGQYASGHLPSSELYSIGGRRFGKAYDPSEFSGDHALAGYIELSWRNIPIGEDWRLSPNVFYDLGAAWGYGSADSDQRLSGASLGVGITFSSAALSGSVLVAKPLTRAVASQGSDGDEARAFAKAAYHF